MPQDKPMINLEFLVVFELVFGAPKQSKHEVFCRFYENCVFRTDVSNDVAFNNML